MNEPTPDIFDICVVLNEATDARLGTSLIPYAERIKAIVLAANAHGDNNVSNIGRVIYGYCNGYFGRDSYHDKRIEAEGVDWIVARAVDEGYAKRHGPEFTDFEDASDKQPLIDRWSSQQEEID